MKSRVFLPVAAAAMLLIAGCASDKDELLPSDLTVAQLEAKMNAATDPQGVFAKSSSYIMRQEIREKQLLDDDIEQMVEVKYRRPDKFALITYQDNKPASVFCTNGKRGWVADCRSRRIIQLNDRELNRMLRLAQLGKPGGEGYSSVFKKVEIFRCINRHGEFYRLDCFADEGASPITFYVGKDDFLLRRVKMTVEAGSNNFDYEAVITDYDWRFNVLIPMVTEIQQYGVQQRSKVIYYQIDPVIPESDFLPPVF